MPSQTRQFLDRADAGQKLAKALPRINKAKTIVMALPRGGVPVAAEICEAFRLPLDLIFVRKIGLPGQPELAMGAVSDGRTPRFVINEAVAQSARLSSEDVKTLGRELLPEIEQRRRTYLAGRAPLDLAGKTVIVVDDGVATGATLRASLIALQDTAPGRTIVALPVGPADLAARLGNLADEVICLADIRHFGAVGNAYRSFPQSSDATVRAAIEQFSPLKTR